MSISREVVKGNLEKTSLMDGDRQIAQGVLDAMPDDYLESLWILVQHEQMGWRFVIDNFRAKIELLKKDADGSEWEELFAAEAKALEGIEE